MIRKDSSATTNVSAVRLDPDYIRKIKWWTSDEFEDKKVLEAVELIAGRAIVEASGGITLDSLKEVARTGVDVISVGALTHQINSLDIGLDFE